MSISGFKINDPIFKDPNLAKKLDLNNDGQVSFKELKKISKNDGDKNDLSVRDLTSIGITDIGIQSKVIDAYKEHSSSVNLLSFGKPNKEQSILSNNSNNNLVEGPNGPGDAADGVDSWKTAMHEKDRIEPENDIKKGSRSFRKSELSDDNAKELFKLLGNDKEAGHYISKLFKENPEKAIEISKSLSKYLNTESPNGALFDPKLKEGYVKDILHDIAYPTDIAQRQEGTCAATSVQVKLARENPQKYVEIATSLANGQNSNNISPNRKFDPEFNNDFTNPNADSRTLSAKVMQNAFMDYANAGKDWGSRESDSAIDGGLYDKEIDKLQTNLFGNTSVRENNDNTFKQIDESLAKGNSVPFSAFSVDPKTNKSTGHEMLLLSKNQDDGSYNIFTWGRVEKMSESDLKKYLKTAQISDN